MKRLYLALGIVWVFFALTLVGRAMDPPPAKTKVYAAWPFDAREAAKRQDETAAALKGKRELELDLGDGVTLKAMLIPAGKFVMGSPTTEQARLPFEGPQHPVTLTKPYFLGATEVTQEQFQAVMGSNPSAFKNPASPVENVTWIEAADFCKKLSESSGQTVRLPTEAEWEFACRAGTKTLYSFKGDLANYGWNNDNATKKTHPVAQLKANPFGLYDMHGNVWEWCSDWYEETYYAKSPAVDPRGPTTAQKRSVRGGAWASRPERCTTAVRGGGAPQGRANYFGFRVVVEPGER